MYLGLNIPYITIWWSELTDKPRTLPSRSWSSVELYRLTLHLHIGAPTSNTATSCWLDFKELTSQWPLSTFLSELLTFLVRFLTKLFSEIFSGFVKNFCIFQYNYKMQKLYYAASFSFIVSALGPWALNFFCKSIWVSATVYTSKWKPDLRHNAEVLLAVISLSIRSTSVKRWTVKVTSLIFIQFTLRCNCRVSVHQAFSP